MKKIIIGLIMALFLASCGGTQQDIINPDADYVYFFWATCPHCIELNKQIEEADILDKLSVEKREVWHNNENQKVFQELVNEIGLDESKVGVPFVYEKSTGEHVVGTDQAFEMLSGSLK